MTIKNMIKRGNFNNRGQITIFIILGIVIVSAILVFFLWIKPTYITPTGGRLNFERCMEDVVKESVVEIGKQGGFVNPELYYLYQGDKIGYLCYTNLYYQTCVVQVPFIKQNFENELLKKSKDKVEACFDANLNALEREGYDITQTGGKELKITLDPGRINAEFNAPVFISRESGSGARFTKFRTQINSPIYDMLMVATSLVQFEAKFGDSDTSSIMFYYPNMIIDKLKQGDETKIYIIEEKETKTKFQFAVRSLAWPAGYGVDSGLVRKQ